MPKPTDQLRDITIVLAEVKEDTDYGTHYAVTRVWRGDFAGTPEDLENIINAYPQLFVEGDWAAIHSSLV